MAEYIEREAFIEWLKRIPLIDLSDGRGLCRVIMEDDFKKAIKKMPKGIIADVAPVRHGRWIKESDGGTRCSVCNKRVRDVTGGWDEPVDLSDMPYCPKCGARMIEEGNT